MRCSDCPYFWYSEADEMLICHWVSRAPGDIPPCEQEDDYEEDDF